MVLLLPLRPAIPSLPFVMNRGLILWGESRVELAERHRPVARRESSSVARGTQNSMLPSRSGTSAFRSKAALLRQCEDLASGQPLRGPSDPEPGHADRPWDPVGQLEELDRDATIVML